MDERISEPVQPPAVDDGRLASVTEVAQMLGVSVDYLQELLRSGKVSADLHAGHLLVQNAEPVPAAERLVEGTVRAKARHAQKVALQHLMERLFEPVVPQRSI